MPKPQYKFHKSCNWGRWSRVLSDTHPHGPFVEVNLTPIYSWEVEVRPVRIRIHGTARGHCSRDISANELPDNILRLMVSNLGEELTERLLNEDFLSLVDFEQYQRHNNGGANLDSIRVDA